MRRTTLLAMLACLSFAAAAKDHVIYAVGDIAECAADPQQAPAARTAHLVPDGAPVLMLGDAVYPLGETRYFESCYGPTWGRHLANTLPVPGNHEYYAKNAAGFFAYFGARAGVNGYFADDIGDWLVIGLNSNLAGEALDRQYSWLEQVLAQRSGTHHCLLAAWHHPLFSSRRHGKGAEGMKRFWDLLEAHHADLVLNGHEHFYERFAPQDGQGRATPAGIREIIAGTGGGELDDVSGIAANSLVRDKAFGVLRLTLGDGGYRWRFLTVGGGTADNGSARCHR